jgi:hypothetical protein
VVRKLGFDPLLEMPDVVRFQELLVARGKKGARLKPLLLDQVQESTAKHSGRR